MTAGCPSSPTGTPYRWEVTMTPCLSSVGSAVEVPAGVKSPRPPLQIKGNCPKVRIWLNVWMFLCVSSSLKRRCHLLLCSRREQLQQQRLALGEPWAEPADASDDAVAPPELQCSQRLKEDEARGRLHDAVHHANSAASSSGWASAAAAAPPPPDCCWLQVQNLRIQSYMCLTHILMNAVGLSGIIMKSNLNSALQYPGYLDVDTEATSGGPSAAREG